MKTNCPLPKGFSGTRHVSGILIVLLALLLSIASVAGAAPFAYVPNSANTVSVIDAAPPAGCPGAGQTPPCIVKTLTLPVGASPGGVAVNPAGTFVYVANTADNSVLVISTSDNSVTSILVGFGPWGVAVSADNSKVYVGLADGSVAEIDVNRANQVTSIPNVGGMLNGLVVAGSRVYVGDGTAGQVVVIDGNTRNVVRRIDVGSPPNSSPMGLVASPDGTRVYVVDLNFDQVLLIKVLEVSTIDTALIDNTGRNPVVATTVIDPKPPTGSLPPEDTRATPGGIAMSPDGSRLYVTNDLLDQVTIITLSNGSRADVGVGIMPIGVATDPTGRVYVANVGDRTVSVLDPATNAVVKTVDIGSSPSAFGAFATAGPPQYALTLMTVGDGSITALPAPVAGTYDAGTVVTLTATPAAGSRFTSWSGACSGSSNPCSVTMDAAKSVTAIFTVQYTLWLTTVGDGSIAAQPTAVAGKYDAGTVVTLTATPAAGSLFTSWSGACSGSSNPCSVTMDAVKSVTATFTAQYTLWLTTIGAGSIAAQPAPVVGKYAASTVVTLTAAPAPGSLFASWSGACSGSSNPCNVTMDAAKSVTATFTAQYVLTLTNVGAGSIAAQPTPAGGTYAVGTVVTLTAISAPGSQFTSWSGACTGSSNPCTVTMDAAKGVTANFALKQYALTLTTAGTGSGSITAQPAGGTYPHGMMVTLTAVPAANSQFTSWSGACSGSATTCNVTMDMVKGVTANFALKQYALTLTTVGAGSITANPVSVGGMYSHGTIVSLTPTPAAGPVAALTATPAAGSQFSGWSGACSGTGACNVTMDAAKSVTATFTATPPPPPAPTTCDDKIKDLQNKVAADKHPWRHDHQLKAALRLYSAAQVELGKAKAKVGDGDKRYVRAMKEFNNGKGALCSGHYWRAHHELWESYYLAHEILKHYRR